ncbi:hypothetical protein [Streptomyces sp. NPDC054961]
MHKKAGLAVVAVVSAALMAIAPSASAYSTATNTRRQIFDTYPTTDAISCMSKRITLAQYWYDWQSVMFGGTPGSSKEIKLAADDYTWTDCIAYDSPGIYKHWSTLTGDHHATATLGDVRYTFTDDPGHQAQYWALWGSQLVPLHS